MRPSAVGEITALPEVTDEDLEDLERRWRVTFDAARRDILRSNDSFDVQACPGSGKTTLLVAKLSILARKWTHSRRGICVLSHTNVARQEVERSLTGRDAGQHLLAYPHFVGTMHSFVNEFLALPLIRSEGLPVSQIDDEASGSFCRRVLNSNGAFATARAFLARKRDPEAAIRGLRFEGAGLLLGTAGADIGCGPATGTYKQLLKIKNLSVVSGLWRHDDMFACAERLLLQHPYVAEYARWRFPAVFIDEMQDTSEMQNRVLARLFPLEECMLRQRFGDPNQAIYDDDQAEASTDIFPSEPIRAMPNSLRFGPAIARKAEPLAPKLPAPGLVGDGPRGAIGTSRTTPPALPHTVFLVSAGSLQDVLPAYGRLLLATFSDVAIHEGTFCARAIGHISKPNETGDNKPRSISDYWVDYEPRAAKPDPNPRKLADYFHLAQRKRATTLDCADTVRTAAKGLLELVASIEPIHRSRSRQGLRVLRELMAHDEAAQRLLHGLLWQWCVELEPLRESAWPITIDAVRNVIRPIVGDRWSAEASAFCEWSAEFASASVTISTHGCAAINRYSFEHDSRQVDIELGTIHGAKGQTHTATLVLESFFKKHDLGDLVRWLSGQLRGAPSEGPERLKRMRVIYTAMTRPTHLLCLAMRAEALGAADTRDASIERLRSVGWLVEDLG